MVALPIYQALTQLGETIDQGFERSRKAAYMRDLGGSIEGGDYAGAAKRALASGDVMTGLKLLELGQNFKNDEAARRALGPGAGVGSVTQPGQPMSLPGSGPFDVNKSFELFKRAGASDEEARTFAAITQAESSGNPMAHNDRAPDNSYGLAQINMFGNLGPERLKQFGLSKPEDLYDPETNARVALAIERQRGGFDDWSTYKSGAYKRFLPGQPVRVADASGTVPQSAMPAGGNDRAALIAERNRLSTITPSSESLRANVKQRIDAIDFQLKEMDRESWSTIRPTDVNLPPDFKGVVQRDARTGQIRVQKAGPDTVISGEKSYDQTLGKGYGETMLEMQKAGRAANSALSSLSLMEKAINTPGFYSGSASELVNAARKAAVSLGVADAASAAPNEIFDKIGNKLVLDLAGGTLGTGFSNADREFIASTVANRQNTPEGNKQIIQIMRAAEQRKLEVAKLARDYVKENGRLDPGFDDQLAQWAERNRLFKDQPTQPQGNLMPLPPEEAALMREAIAGGADRAKVLERARSRKFDTTGFK